MGMHPIPPYMHKQTQTTCKYHSNTTILVIQERKTNDKATGSTLTREESPAADNRWKICRKQATTASYFIETFQEQETTLINKHLVD